MTTQAEALIIGSNVKSSVKAGKLVLEIDLKQELGLSASGKNMMIAKTGGNKSVPTPAGQVVIGLNVYKPAQ